MSEDGSIISSDQTLRNELASRNSKLVTFVVNKLYSKKKEHKQLREDLLQEGFLGLLSAIDGFDPSLGFKFSTYSTYWIKQSINTYLLGQDPQLKVPLHIRTAQNKVLKKLKSLNMTFVDLTRENAKTLGVSTKMIDSINCSLKTKWITSLDQGMSENNSSNQKNTTTFLDLLEDKTASCEEKIDKENLIKIFKDGLAQLKERERLILLLRYDVLETTTDNG